VPVDQLALTSPGCGGWPLARSLHEIPHEHYDGVNKASESRLENKLLPPAMGRIAPSFTAGANSLGWMSTQDSCQSLELIQSAEPQFAASPVHGEWQRQLGRHSLGLVGWRPKPRRSLGPPAVPHPGAGRSGEAKLDLLVVAAVIVSLSVSVSVSKYACLVCVYTIWCSPPPVLECDAWAIICLVRKYIHSFQCVRRPLLLRRIFIL
jgi:hypothetical protein